MMDGYIRKFRVSTGAQPPKTYRLIIRVDETDPVGGARLVGRMVLRGIAGLDGLQMPAMDALPEGAHLRPVGRISALSEAPTVQPSLRAVQSGLAYRMTSAANRNMVSPALAEALEQVFQEFASRQGFTPDSPLAVGFSRGYARGDRGHGTGLAVDIASVGGRSLLQWKQSWDQALARARDLAESERRAAVQAEAQENPGYQLYRALLDRGGWRVFNNVVQLFGPWTSTLGPWKRLRFESPSDPQRQLMNEQEHIYRAHQDHIHVALG